MHFGFDWEVINQNAVSFHFIPFGPVHWQLGVNILNAVSLIQKSSVWWNCHWRANGQIESNSLFPICTQHACWSMRSKSICSIALSVPQDCRLSWIHESTTIYVSKQYKYTMWHKVLYLAVFLVVLTMKIDKMNTQIRVNLDKSSGRIDFFVSIYT